MQLRVNRAYARLFGCDLEEAELDIGEYKCLSDFFKRKLKPDARPLTDPNAQLVQALSLFSFVSFLVFLMRSFISSLLLSPLFVG